MSLKTKIYGSNARSRAQRVFMHTLFAVLLLNIYALTTQFLPTEFGKRLALYLATGTTVMLTLLYWRSFWKGDIRWARKPKYRSSRVLLALMGPPFLVFLFLWGPFSVVLPDLLTRAFGEPSVYVMQAETERYRRIKAGDGYRLIGLEADRQKKIKISPSDYRRLQPGGNIKITGVRTILGTHVDDLELVARPVDSGS